MGTHTCAVFWAKNSWTYKCDICRKKLNCVTHEKFAAKIREDIRAQHYQGRYLHFATSLKTVGKESRVLLRGKAIFL